MLEYGDYKRKGINLKDSIRNYNESSRSRNSSVNKRGYNDS